MKTLLALLLATAIVGPANAYEPEHPYYYEIWGNRGSTIAPPPVNTLVYRCSREGGETLDTNISLFYYKNGIGTMKVDHLLEGESLDRYSFRMENYGNVTNHNDDPVWSWVCNLKSDRNIEVSGMLTQYGDGFATYFELKKTTKPEVRIYDKDWNCQTGQAPQEKPD